LFSSVVVDFGCFMVVIRSYCTVRSTRLIRNQVDSGPGGESGWVGKRKD